MKREKASIRVIFVSLSLDSAIRDWNLCFSLDERDDRDERVGFERESVKIVMRLGFEFEERVEKALNELREL
ncbi:hypothetical protein A2U01_0063575 [Trifolium medium]|uniref:Uncharacterized protein n=1 Tax=Trifolium medium TaxID=97028 RepID=A0A392S0E4_9FABA|nr:hypothetical protein [Trifolium medium]